MRITPLILTTLLLSQSCTPSSSTDSTSDTTKFPTAENTTTDSTSETSEIQSAKSIADEKAFAHVINSIPVVPLPRQLEYWRDNPIPPVTDSIAMQWQVTFWKAHAKSVWGRVYVNQPNIHLLATHPDDRGTVFLITYDRSGALLNEESLQRGHYVSADIESATSNYSTLHPDLRLVEIDSLFRYRLNETEDDRVEGSETCQVTFHEYKINTDGSLKDVRYDTTAFFKTGY